MSKHTKLPWEVFSRGGGFAGMSRGKPVVSWTGFDSSMYQRQNEANAKFIIRACNSHDLLLEALKQAISGCRCSMRERDSGHRTDCHAPHWQEIVDKATGEPS